ncbi:MAG: Na/Pi cotransporter family protein [Clostridia bacterium]|nr:Na/Pi cotransporter family protein [Clostridia bacterium]
MSIIDFITLIGGVAFFLYGMTVMSNGLEKMSGGKLEATLKKMTSNVFKSLALGAGITIAMQSSSAMTVMLVGLVNSGIMNLRQTVGLIMGSNIGTTLTAFLTSLIGVESSGDGFNAMDLMKPANFSLMFALVGVLFVMGKDKKRRDIGNIIVGFAVLMCGMGLMGDSVSALKDDPEFAKLLTVFQNPIFGVIIGAVITGIIQSSAASVAILQTLVGPGSGFTYGMAIPIIMGQNIGTCVTALISSIGVNRNAKRVAVVHISFNIIGTVLGLIVLYSLNAIFSLAFMAWEIDALGIAICHLTFNLFATLVLLPFQNALVKLANKIIRDKEGVTEKVQLLDERLLATPAIAISECRNITVRMSGIVKEALIDSLEVLNGYDTALAERVVEDEGVVDKYEDKLGTYLVKLSSDDITVRDSQNVSTMLHCIGNFERISDHAVEIVKTAEELNDKKLQFSSDAQKEVAIAEAALREIIDITFTAFENGDTSLARKVEPLEQVIDSITASMRSNHISRLQAGNCTIELGFILNDLINCFERVSDHCSNIAVALIEVAEGEFATHKYLNNVKSGNDEQFKKDYESYSDKYAIVTVK